MFFRYVCSYESPEKKIEANCRSLESYCATSSIRFFVFWYVEKRSQSFIKLSVHLKVELKHFMLDWRSVVRSTLRLSRGSNLISFSSSIIFSNFDLISISIIRSMILSPKRSSVRKIRVLILLHKGALGLRPRWEQKRSQLAKDSARSVHDKSAAAISRLGPDIECRSINNRIGKESITFNRSDRGYSTNR